MRQKMQKKEIIAILSEELQVTETVIAYFRDFGREGEASPSHRMKRKEALRMAIAALEEEQEPAGDDAYRDALEKIRSLEAYIRQVQCERDIALQQLGEIGISLGEKMDSVKEAVKRQKPEPCVRYPVDTYPGRIRYLCPSCGHEIKRSDNDGMVQLVQRPGCCPKCGQAIQWEDKEEKSHDQG